MKYHVLVEKQDDMFIARCPAVPHLAVTGKSINSVVVGLSREFLCYVHDRDAQLEFLMSEPKQKTDTRNRPHTPPIA